MFEEGCATESIGLSYRRDLLSPHSTDSWFTRYNEEVVLVHGFIPPRSSAADELARAQDIAISDLPTLRLRMPISARIRFDSGEWIVEATHLPLYGSGGSRAEAIEMLQREIESLWDDLNADDAFSRSWLTVRRFLARIIDAE